MIKYLVPFLTAFFITASLVFFGLYVGKKINWMGRDSERHIHRKGTLRIGGVAMIVAFNLAILINADLVITPELCGVMAATLVLMLAGIWDDLREIFWKNQLLFQVAAVVLVFIFGVRIYAVTNPLTGGIIKLESGIGMIISMMLVLVWTILMINSMNWIDGIDGLSGGITLIGALTIFFLSLKPEVNQPPMAIISMILAGTALGFLIFNFNPSFVLAGTAGSTFMGFALAMLAIFAGTKIATSILVMSVPVVDFLWVIGERLKDKKSIFKPDANHLHYKLLGLGWSQRKTVIYFYAITVLISVIALNTKVIGKTITLFTAVFILVIALAYISKKIKNQTT
jgi:UDP-GlcNAc:undecaprenyl-phosphate/decaprenyl-phosphate GlcNAc-1-phosphate transferase